MPISVNLIAAFVSLTSALAVSTTAKSPGLFLCQNTHFHDHPNFCNKYTSPWGQCTIITDLFPPGDRSVSSAGPDSGNWCTLYENEGCTGEELQVYYPGYFDLKDVGWNDQAKSFNCAAV